MLPCQRKKKLEAIRAKRRFRDVWNATDRFFSRLEAIILQEPDPIVREIKLLRFSFVRAELEQMRLR